MIRIFAMLAAIAILAGGCVLDPAYYDKKYKAENEKLMATGSYLAVYSNLAENRELARQDEYGDAARALLARYPDFYPKLEATLRQWAARQTGNKAAIAFFKEVRKAVAARVIPPDLGDALLVAARESVRRSMAEGAGFLLLTDDYQAIGLGPAEKQYIVEASVRVLTSHRAPPADLVEAVFREARLAGSGSESYRVVAAALPKMHLSRAQMEGIVIPAMPGPGREALAARALHVFMTGNDRLLETDIAARILSKAQWVVMADRPGPNTLVVDLEKLQWEERQPPERTETVRYPLSQVTALPPPMRKAKFVSYAFEHTSGEASLEYAVEVTMSRDGAVVQSDLIRDYLDARWGLCAGQRLENAAGGVQPVPFPANPEMEARCSASARPVDVREFRGTALDRLADAIRLSPPFAPGR